MIKPMTVKELIEILQHFNPETEVYKYFGAGYIAPLRNTSVQLVPDGYVEDKRCVVIF